MENKTRKVLFLIWFTPLMFICTFGRATVYGFRFIKATFRDGVDNYRWYIVLGFFGDRAWESFFNSAWSWWNKMWEKTFGNKEKA